MSLARRFNAWETVASFRRVASATVESGVADATREWDGLIPGVETPG
ncbi:MAG: hypothetical protein ACJ74J_05780 [Blastocatellia bacterium]